MINCFLTSVNKCACVPQFFSRITLISLTIRVNVASLDALSAKAADGDKIDIEGSARWKYFLQL